MSKIIGNTTTTPAPRSDWSQTDKTKADFIRHKPELGAISEKDAIDKSDLTSDMQLYIGQIDTKASITPITMAEYEALEEVDANTLYVLTDEEERELTQVQLITQDNTEILPTLKIHKLTQSEYDEELANGTIDEDALYLTPDDKIFATEQYVDSAIDDAIATIPTPDVSGQIETHNTSSNAHEDIRLSVEDLNTLVGDINNVVVQKSQVQIITWEDDD